MSTTSFVTPPSISCVVNTTLCMCKCAVIPFRDDKLQTTKLKCGCLHTSYWRTYWNSITSAVVDHAEPLQFCSSDLVWHSLFQDVVNAIIYPVLPDSQNTVVCQKVSRLRPLIFMVRATCRWRWIWNIGGMILTVGKQRQDAASNRSNSLVLDNKILHRF
jgi:hypothetical protein